MSGESRAEEDKLRELQLEQLRSRGNQGGYDPDYVDPEEAKLRNRVKNRMKEYLSEKYGNTKERVKNAPAAVKEYTVEKVKSGASATKEHFSKGYVWLFWGTLIWHIIDGYRFGFSRSQGMLTTSITVYVVIAVIAWAFVFRPSGKIGSFKELFQFLVISAICVGLPFILKFFPNAGIVAFNLTWPELLSFALLLVPIWPIYIGNTFEYRKGMNLLTIIWVFVLLGYLFIGIYNSNLDNVVESTGVRAPVDQVFSTVKEGWTKFWNNMAGVGPKFTDFVYRQVDPQYQSEVDKNTGPEVGVYIKKLEPSVTRYNGCSGQGCQGDQIVAYADIQARSFSGDVTVLNTCYLDKISGSVDVPSFTVNQYDYRQLVCSFPPDIYGSLNLTAKQNYVIKFESDFTFSTYGYMTYVFMDQNLYNTYRSKKQDINGMYNIPKVAQAVYTNGPITLGLVDPQNPLELPYSVSQTQPILPIVGITIKNKDAENGQVIRINSLIFKMPKPLALNTSSCYSQSKVEFAESKDTFNDQVNVYTLQDTPMKYPKDLPYITIRCRMVLKDATPQELLGKGISFNTVLVNASYDYSLTKSTPVTILEGIPNP